MASSSFQPKNQSPPTVIRFFKIVLSKTLQAGTLKIPGKFSRKHGGDVPNPVYLKPPDGTKWKIDWSDHDGEILFENGWKEFAAYYSLLDGHLLWFEFKESALFEVHIFDTSGLEIDYPLNDQTDEDFDDDFVENLNKPPPRPRKRSKAAFLSPSTTRQLGSATKTRDVERGSQSEETNLEIPVFSSAKQDFFEFYPGTGGFMALKEAQKFSSENPFFIVKIRQARRSNANLPASFFKKYFKKYFQKVKLRFEGKLFPAKLSYYRDTSHALISAGWRRFARESKLQPGDVILFELVDRDDPVFETHIYRAQAFKSRSGGFESLKAAQNFKSKNPSFMVKISNPSILKTTAAIPIPFFTKYFAKKKKVNINIRMGSKLLPVRLLYYPSFGNAYISAGWKAFLVACNLKAGDVCIFELINEKDQVLDVHIYRAGEEFQELFITTSTMDIDYPLNDGTDDDFDAISNKPPPRPRKRSKAALLSPSTTRQLRSDTKTRDVERGSQSEETNLEIPVFSSASQDFFDFYPGTGGFQALKEAQKFSSDNPFIIVKIRQTIRTTANFPASFFTKYFKNEQQKVKIRFEGRLFPAKLCYYRDCYTAIISAGWPRFVQASKLQPGDVILFELVDKDDPVLEAHLYRAQAFKSQSGGFQSLKAAQNFKSENPSFMIKITSPIVLKKAGAIPFPFFTKYFAKKKMNINIRMGSKLLPVKLRCYPSLRAAYISAGWNAFVVASNLKVGDVCIFELINEKDQVLDVHIYRAGEELQELFN
ncbi:hypothetical protein PIB30_034071 [Stylosanthes scabra]|uniref:TF-B3 domain-containing protein n=1 Tax=Stylosanthes scabra TaxID=79078 RepID=A0ABU6ZBK9_9FABA|nr:hypothetical protein [Stylosanthes scabra]